LAAPGNPFLTLLTTHRDGYSDTNPLRLHEVTDRVVEELTELNIAIVAGNRVTLAYGEAVTNQVQTYLCRSG
jgi:hypothetical protein